MENAVTAASSLRTFTDPASLRRALWPQILEQINQTMNLNLGMGFHMGPQQGEARRGFCWTTGNLFFGMREACSVKPGRLMYKKSQP